MNNSRDDILMRLFEYRTALKETDTKSAEATRNFPNCCCVVHVYSAPYIQLLQREAHQSLQNVGFCYTEYTIFDTQSVRKLETSRITVCGKCKSYCTELLYK